MLLDLLLLLVAAKVAAELAERLKVPAVLAEILAGVVLGPSVLGVVAHGEVLVFLGELGVILLLLEVGLEMDLGELGAVGKASMLVAVAGVTLPFAGGFAVASLLGQAAHPAIFVGAALTATSVGITARVFGDLRALGTVEARTVLGAAVADDVLGLVILTVVVRIVSTGSVSILGIAGVIGAAVVFLVASGGAGIRLAPRLFAEIDGRARSAGILVVAAVIFTLLFAELATLAKLAPIIGAFVAGLSLGKTRQAERIRRELSPIGHVLVPVFFVSIGIDVDVKQLIDPKVLGLAAGLLVVAIVGKVAAALAAVGTTGDRWLIGLGMLPRGEVGLIFAGLGLREGVLGEDLYAALLVVVLGTTLITPPLLRSRLLKVVAARRNAPGQAMPAEGWLKVDADQVELRSRRPSSELATGLALQVARLVAEGRRPGPHLLDWFSGLDPQEELGWDRGAQRELFSVLRAGNARSWRFLETTGMLDRVLPELAATLDRRRQDASELDPLQGHRWATVEAVQALAGTPEYQRLEHPDRLLVAALVLDVSGDDEPPVVAARQLVRRLRLGVEAEQEVAFLLADHGLLRANAVRPDGLDEDRVVPLAVHVATAERARALHLLTRASDDLARWERERMDELLARVLAVLAQTRVTGIEARTVADKRRAEAMAMAKSPAVRERLLHAPRPWILGVPSESLVRQATLLEPPPTGSTVRASVVGDRIELACRDRRGLLAAVTRVLTDARLTIREATTATWADGGAVLAFDVDGPDVDGPQLAARVEAALAEGPPAAAALPEATVTFDDAASPWYTLADVEAPDRTGLLRDLTAAFTAAGVSIHSARVTTADGRALDRFELTDRRGGKLSEADQAVVLAVFQQGATSRPSGLRRTRKAAIVPKHSGHSVETAAP
jgi:Kef-type K+ transport system membrane component KefB/glycine cleavage system regulatory protein